jgi:hypothetical protein
VVAAGVGYNQDASPQLFGWASYAKHLSGPLYSYSGYDVTPIPGQTVMVAGKQIPKIKYTSFTGLTVRTAVIGNLSFWALGTGGIAATAKHFPGRGDSATDAHDVLDVIRADKQRMREVELVPFKAAIDAGVKAVMTGHSVYPAYDDEFPTTLSEKLLTGLLREEARDQDLRNQHRAREAASGRHPF